MITAVDEGYHEIIRWGYKRMPMEVVIAKDGKSMEIRNYLGRKLVKKIVAPHGVTMSSGEGANSKNIILSGIDNILLGQLSGRIRSCCKPRGLDKRKFEDGLYRMQQGTGLTPIM